jgi:tRNA (mo5U34)-methyltransferase
MAATEDRTVETVDAQAAVARVRSWYHSIELAPGVVTPGAFDLRPILDRLPWPDVRGKRCLDVGTYDGFFAFELERRGAAEVVATDIPSHEHWDWELHLRARGPEYLRHAAGTSVGAGFHTAREVLRSAVRLDHVSAYDLSPDSLGSFDVVVCGSLLLHLRDPLRALASIRSVCRGQLLFTNQVERGLSLLHRRRPLARIDGTSGLTQWWIPNRAGNRQLLRAAGFEIIRESGLYSIPFGAGRAPVERGPRQSLVRLARRGLGRDGVPHHAVLARPLPS